MTGSAVPPRSARVATTLGGINDDLQRVTGLLPHLERRDAALVHEHLLEIERSISAVRTHLDWLWWRSSPRVPRAGVTGA
ncbi:MAG: hypothetical protein U0237_11670 [Thermoleophilia bacterium]